MAIIHGQFHRDVSVILAFSHKRDSTKQILKNITVFVLFVNLIWRLHVKLSQY